MEPISIHIPPQLRHLAISPSSFYETHPDCERLVVGAFIFQQLLPEAEPAILLVQRASTESFPNAWEVPGGSVEGFDPTILHSVAREVFEETGLHLTRVVREVGKGLRFTTRFKCLKLSFEIEVSEIQQPSAKEVSLHKSNSQKELKARSFRAEEEREVSVTLDPAEHQRYAWVVEEDIKTPERSVDKLSFVAEDQQQAMLAAFESRRTAKNALAELFTTSVPMSQDHCKHSE